jgi:hypothetical protein
MPEKRSPRRPATPQTVTTVAPLPAIHCDQFSLTLGEHVAFVAFFGEAVIELGGQPTSVPVFTAAMSAANLKALASSIQSLFAARQTAQADMSNPQ